MKFEISSFFLYDLNDFFSLIIVKLFRHLAVSCLLSMLMVAPAYAQFTLLPSTTKTIAECNDPSSVFSQFLLTGQFPESSDVNNAKDYQDAMKQNQDIANEIDKQLPIIVSDMDQMKGKLDYNVKSYSDCIAQNKGSCDAEKKAVSDLQNEIFKDNDKYAQLLKDKEAAQQKFLDAQKNESKNSSMLPAKDLASAREDILACAIKTGRASLSLIPYFITYIINFALGLVGLISVLFIVIGGYRYVVGGLGEDKEKGKKTISSALMGMGLALLAWSIVNIILKAITG